MLAFITSLRHPQNSADYHRVEELLRETLQSVCAQTNRDFRVYVVGNKEPGFELPENVQFVPVAFPPPTDIVGPQTGREAVLRDKGTKLAVGLLAAAQDGPTHVMVVDSDDYVSRQLASLVAESPESAGWVVNDGYVYSSSSSLIQRVDRFNERCGTSLILRTSLFDLPELSLASDQDELIAGLGAYTVRELLGSHRAAVPHFEEAGHPLTPVPFAAAVYRVETGENHSGKGFSGFGRPVTSRLATEFGLPAAKTDVSVLAASLRSVGSWAAIHTKIARRRARTLVTRGRALVKR